MKRKTFLRHLWWCLLLLPLLATNCTGNSAQNNEETAQQEGNQGKETTTTGEQPQDKGTPAEGTTEQISQEPAPSDTSAEPAPSDTGAEPVADTNTAPDEASTQDAGMEMAPDTTTDTGMQDAGEMVAEMTKETGATDGTGLEQVNPEGGACPEGTCRLGAGGKCEAPTGQMGNGCCKCENSVCTQPCRCNAPDTQIATPSGPRAIASLKVGDLVYSVHKQQIVAVPIRRLHRVPVTGHTTILVRLANGAHVESSPTHPTADGRVFRDLRTGGTLDGITIKEAKAVPYPHNYTYDILPASDTGSYFAGGARIGSTLTHLAPPLCRR